MERTERTEQTEQNNDQSYLASTRFLQKTQPFEVNSEFVLPDYRSEISKLLWVRPVVSAPICYRGGGKADLSGAVKYEVLYVGPDGGLYGTELEDGYAFSVPSELPEGMEQGTEAVLSGTVQTDAVISRVAAPRKLSVRLRMHGDVSGFGTKSLAPSIEGSLSLADAEKRCAAIDHGKYYGSAVETVEVEGALFPETEEDLRIITAHGEVFLPENTVYDGTVHTRGECLLTVLATADREDAVPFAMTLTIPLECELPIDGVPADAHARSTGTVGSISTAVEDGKLTVSATVHIAAEAAGCEPVVAVEDLFFAGKRAECHMGETLLFAPGACGNRNLTVSGESTKKDLLMGEDAEVLDAFATAELRERTVEGSAAVLAGEICCRMLTRSGKEYGTAELRVPFRTTWEEGGTELTAALSVPKCKLRTDRDRVMMTAELALSVRGATPMRVARVETVELEQDAPTPRTDIELYYPAARETLFDIGKRYGTAPTRIADANHLDESDTALPDGTRYLIIPPQ